MGLSNVERQRRYRARQQALVKANPEVAERALLEEAEQCAQLSDACTMAATSLATSGRVASSRTKFGGMIYFLGAATVLVFQRADRA
jgi:hypothetical protein